MADVCPQPDGPGFVSVSTMANALRRPKRTVRYWCEKGYVRAERTPGGHYRIPRAELERARGNPPSVPDPAGAAPQS